jgi:hypothetical protein
MLALSNCSPFVLNGWPIPKKELEVLIYDKSHLELDGFYRKFY